MLHKGLQVASCILVSCVLFRILAFMSSTASELKILREPSEELPTRFLYLLETESCLPNHLNTAEAIGKDTTCQCDVLTLSFRNVCKVSGSPHIFKPGTTWAAGRNLLYKIAKRRSEKYLYYIFLDDDILLKVKLPRPNENPWRLFENFLNRIQPAV